MTLNSKNNDDNISAFPDVKAIEQEAADWIALRERRELTPEEYNSFEAWKARSPQHCQMLDELTGVWSDLDSLDDLHAFALPPEADEETDESASEVANNISDGRAIAHTQRIAVPRLGVLAAIAASLALVVAGVVSLQNVTPWETNIHATYETALGEQRTFVLADGSAVMLNTASVVEIDFTRGSRAVHLIKGEAHFDVAHDASKPFSVYAGENIIRAVGIAFSVRVGDKSEVEVIVDEGRVALLREFKTARDDSHYDHAVQAEPIGEVNIGGAATVKGATFEMRAQLSNEELLRKLAWRQGRLSFAGEPLSEVLGEISRYTDIEIEVADPSLEIIPIGGAFRVGEVDEFFSALETSFGVNITRVSDKHVRLSRSS